MNRPARIVELAHDDPMIYQLPGRPSSLLAPRQGCPASVKRHSAKKIPLLRILLPSPFVLVSRNGGGASLHSPRDSDRKALRRIAMKLHTFVGSPNSHKVQAVVSHLGLEIQVEYHDFVGGAVLGTVP
jgi:hypothetical protein